MRDDFPIVKLKEKRDIPLKAGHPWIFSNAIANSIKAKAGALVKVVSNKEEFLGIGMWNPAMSIRVRMLARQSGISPCPEFFAGQFTRLEQIKKKFLPPLTSGYRLVHGDADCLPGLIVDCYEDVFVFQIHTLGMDQFRAMIIEGLQRAFSPSAIVERSDVESRRAEGLKDFPVGVRFGKVDSFIKFKECGHLFYADILKGQKTGFFLDQRGTRIKIAQLAKGMSVLNLFSYSGASSVYAVCAGAKGVISVDSSAPALELARKNFALNSIDLLNDNRFEFIEEDVFDLLASGKLASREFNLIICDPPPFTKSKANISAALKMYTRLNMQCLSLLKKDGILITSSCSGSLTAEDFRDTLRLSSGQAKQEVRVIECLGQPFDHTDKLSFPEGRYLKTLILEVTGTC
ncbi:MAG: class I SAM-dependent rRNA methyltransferase [Candidatus Omnitrophica bacterium]|nr:class I SAM-dependent rRNA methyltransferase [Candidatus Omnitrophota bacterium]